MDVLSSPLRPWTVVCLLLMVTFSYVQGANNTLFPYGTEAGDEDIGHIGLAPKAITLAGVTPIKYYGQQFKTAYILKDGMIAFEPGVTYLGEVKWREGTPNVAIDLPFIAPFHYDGYIDTVNPESYKGKIYYKLLTRCRSCPALNQKDEEFVQSLDRYVQSASVVLKSGFKSEFVLKVTWENVTSKEACSPQASACPSNSFQVVLVGNVFHTFAIFNYYKMEIPFNEHQLAGLNGGHGRGWTDVVPCDGVCAKRSQKDAARITSLATRAGSDVQGRYLLVVGDDKIYRGGCVSTLLKGAEPEVYPRQAGMLGGEMLSVSGRCLPAGTLIFCRFAGKDVTQGVMETEMRGRCPVPILTTRGEVSLELSSDNMNWPLKTTITIILPSRLPLPMNMTGIKTPWYSINPNHLTVRWNSDLFSSNGRARLDLNLIGFREDGHAQIPLVFKHLETLASGLTNSDEQYTVDPSGFNCIQECDLFEVAILQLRIVDDDVDETTQRQAVNVGPVTLGWYVKRAMTQRYGTSKWSGAKCKDWNNQDKLNTAWLEHLLPCPCTLAQALADWGRWQPDVGCSMYSGSVCTYHHHAKHCVRSVHPSRDGSGNQCCYEQDGNLRYAADTYQGSTPDRSHDWGATPYGVPGRVPSLSHWIHDVVTFYYCCLWVDNYSECDYYMTRRATRDCKAYVPAHAATVYGDPHITTFDGKTYYFGGSGDFWILKSSTINIQGRFEPRPNEYLQIEAKQMLPTNLTSLVMWISDSDVVTVRKAPTGGPDNRKLDIMVGSQRRFFETKGTSWQDFKRVSITNNQDVATNVDDRLHSNFTILFEGGVGVQVAERQGLLHVLVILPPGSGPTLGLLGTFDGDVKNDFTTPKGEVIPANSQEDLIYRSFATTWNVSQADSKFAWPRQAEADKTPLFGDPASFNYKNPNLKPLESDVTSTCGRSQSCRRDYYVSNDQTVAQASKKAEENFQSLQASQVIVHSCGLLDIPSAAKSLTIYLQGTEVKVTGCRDGSPFQTQGPTTYFCNTTVGANTTSKWSPVPDPDLCPHMKATTPEVIGSGGVRHDVTCGQTEMSFSILLPDDFALPSAARLSDPRCQVDVGGHRLQGRTSLNGCGTKMAFTYNTVLFSNSIFLSHSNHSNDDSVIPIHCTYSRGADLQLSYLPLIRQVLFTEEGVGQFQFQIQQFQDATYSSAVDDASYPLRTNPHQEIFVALSLNDPVPGSSEVPDYGIEVESCIASPLASVTSARLEQYEDLIVDGCPASSSVQLFNKAPISSPVGPQTNTSNTTKPLASRNTFRFSFRSMAFHDPADPSRVLTGLVYIHCHVELCPKARCNDGTACPAHSRKRRSLTWQSHSAGHSLSTGPLLVVASFEEPAMPVSPAMIALSVVAAVASLVAVAVVVAWRRGPRQGQGYRLVKVEDE